MEYMIAPLKKYADFTGRARRMEYWMFVLLQIIVIIPLSIIGSIVSGGDTDGALFNLIILIPLLAFLIPSIAVTVRRLHDTNRSGWWYFIGLVPLIGGIWLFILSVLDGTPGPNRFGPDPKGRGDSNTAEVFA